MAKAILVLMLIVLAAPGCSRENNSRRAFDALDQFVQRHDAGDLNPDLIQSQLVPVCAELVMDTATAEERKAFRSPAVNYEYNRRVGFCADATLNRIRPTAGFTDEERVRKMCGAGDFYRKICTEYGLP